MLNKDVLPFTNTSIVVRCLLEVIQNAVRYGPLGYLYYIYLFENPDLAANGGRHCHTLKEYTVPLDEAIPESENGDFEGSIDGTIGMHEYIKGSFAL